jgi:hypothetical protein
MPKAKTGRKALFKAALALAGMTQDSWAASRDITAGHLSMVLAGKRESVALNDKIDTFTREHLSKHMALVA